MYLRMLLKLMLYEKVLVLLMDDMSLKLWFLEIQRWLSERSSRKLKVAIMSSTILSLSPSLLLKA
jgi:hypothetical protein